MNLVFKDLYVLTRTGSTIINQTLVDSMFAPGAVAIQKLKFSLFLVTNVTLEWAQPQSAFNISTHDRSQGMRNFISLSEVA